MSTKSIINENSTCWLTVIFKDKNGELATPITAGYSIVDMSSGDYIVEFSELTPDDTIEIEITSSQNAILNLENLYEDRKVTISSTYGVDDEFYDEYIYSIKNLSQIPEPLPEP